MIKKYAGILMMLTLLVGFTSCESEDETEFNLPGEWYTNEEIDFGAYTWGRGTIDLYNTSDTRGNSPSYGTNYQKVGHDLASVDELAVLDGGKCILQLRGVRPFKSDKYDLTQHPNYKLTAGADKKNTFSIEAFLDHRLKLKPGDKYEVVDADHAK